MSRTATGRLAAPERLALIEQAATRLFAQRGYAATTVEAIVDEAGLTKPMLYRHFESKQELCVALLERYRAELVAAPLGEFTPGAGDPRPQLPAMIDAWLAHIERHPDAARLLLAPIGGDAEVQQAQREVHARQAATQAALLREFVPGLADEQAEPFGEVVRASLTAVALWWLDRPEIPRAVATGVLVTTVQGILAAIGGPR